MTNLQTSMGFEQYNRRPRLLVADDQPANVRLVNSIFEHDCDVFMALSGAQALDVCTKISPDLILLDVIMPEIDGLSLCKILKQQFETQNIPIIFITALQSSEEETQCWEAGGVDFINKPVNPVTLRNRVKAHLTIKFQTEILRQQAFLDGLTQIANRRRLDEQLEIAFRRTRRNQHHLALLLIDVDYFKQYNDTYGHLAGDDCLRQIAAVLKANMLRPGDLAARYGGEEFVCLLEETDVQGALIVAKKIIENIEGLHIEHGKSFLTVSIGIAVCPSNQINSTEALFERADQYLYLAKQNGRNRIEYQ